MPRQRCAGVAVLHHLRESGNHPFCQPDALRCPFSLHGLVVVAPMAYRSAKPLAALLPHHGSQQVYLSGIGAVVRDAAADHHAVHSGLFPDTGFFEYELVVVEVGECLCFQHQGNGEHAEGVFQRLDATAEEGLDHSRCLDPVEGQGRVYIADEGVSLIRCTVLTAGCHDATVLYRQRFHFGITDKVAALTAQVVDQRLDEQVAVTSQSPAALYVAVLAVGEGKQRQRLPSQLHLQGRTPQHIDEQRVVEGVAEPLVGIGVDQLCPVFRECRGL